MPILSALSSVEEISDKLSRFIIFDIPSKISLLFILRTSFGNPRFSKTWSYTLIHSTSFKKFFSPIISTSH